MLFKNHPLSTKQSVTHDYQLHNDQRTLLNAFLIVTLVREANLQAFFYANLFAQSVKQGSCDHRFLIPVVVIHSRVLKQFLQHSKRKC